jgi:AraC-like DNA-binding protein
MLGALGYALREAPDVGAVIENLNRYLPLHSEGTQTSLALHKDTAYWSCELLAPDTSGMYQQYDLIVGLAVKFLRQLVDPTWAPTNAYLRHAVPADRKPYLNALHCPVTFNADVTAITFPSVLLKRRIPAADCHLYRVLSSYLVQQDSYRPADFSARVRETIAFSLHQVDGSIETVAKHLGMLPRTLQRRLRDSGLSYTSLINDVRRNLSQQYLRDTTMSMTQIATTLGFSESAAFSRWFRREFGVAPRWWRQAIMT